MILSLLATVAVLAAIAVITTALVLAEPTLVYFALGLGGLSVLLLLGAIIQGRFSGSRSDTERTDGLGKSSVPVVAVSAAAGTVPAPPWEPADSGRVPAPVEEPVRESAVPEPPVPPGTPVSEPLPTAAVDSEEEPEFEVPRWQTPTMGNWPEPVVELAESVESAEAAVPTEEPVEELDEAPSRELVEETLEDAAGEAAGAQVDVAPEAEAPDESPETFGFSVPDHTTHEASEAPEALEDRIPEEDSISERTPQEEAPDEGVELVPAEDREHSLEALAEENPAEELAEDTASAEDTQAFVRDAEPAREELIAQTAPEAAEGEEPSVVVAEEKLAEERPAEEAGEPSEDDDAVEDPALAHAAILDAEPDAGRETEPSEETGPSEETDGVHDEPEGPRARETQETLVILAAPGDLDDGEVPVEDRVKQPDSSYSS